jgi:predicted transcriptional regulator
VTFKAEQTSETARACLVFGPLENAIMGVLWKTDQALTVRDILTEVNAGRPEPLAYTTVMTVATRLATKGALYRTKQGRGYAYSTSVSDEAAMAVRDLLRDFGMDAVGAFAEEVSSDPELRDLLERLLHQGPGL